MDYSPSPDKDQLDTLLKKYKLWQKKSPMEQKSLFKALANSIYFSKTAHEYLKTQMFAFFLTNVKHFAKEFHLTDYHSIKDFIHDFSHPRYQNLLLEICALLFKRRIELYYQENDTLRLQKFHSQGKKVIRIIRVTDGHYSALFSYDFKLKVTIAQNIVLCIIDRMLNHPNQKFILKDMNSHSFQNYEYMEWLEHSLSNHNFRFQKIFNYYLSQNPATLAQPIDDASDGKNIGHNIVDLFKERKRKRSMISISEKSGAFTEDCEKLLSDLEATARKRNANFLKVRAKEKRQYNSIEDDYGFGLYMPQDDLNYHDFEDILWKHYTSDNKKEESKEDSEKVIDKEKDNARGQSQKNMNSGDSSNTNISRFLNSPFQTSNHLPSDLIETFKSVDDDDSDNEFSPETTIHPRPSETLKHQIKPSISENFSHALRKETVGSSQSKYVNLLTSEEQVMNDEKTKKKKKKKKKEKGQSKQYRGTLKFFDEKNNFGFILTKIHEKMEDVFVYRSEFEAAGIKLETIQAAKNGAQLTFEFTIAYYLGKYQKSKKALNIKLVDTTSQKSWLPF